MSLMVPKAVTYGFGGHVGWSDFRLAGYIGPLYLVHKTVAMQDQKTDLSGI